MPSTCDVALLQSLVAFFVGALVGGLGIYAGGRLVAGVTDYEHAVWTAVVGALVWAVVSLLFGWLPVLGPVLTLFAWIGVINWRYPGGWLNAAAIAVLAWVASLLALWALSQFGVRGLDVVGVPGV